MKYWQFIFVSFLLFGCTGCESEKYVSEEEMAIEELFTEFIQLDEMLSINDYGDSIPTLYLISQLDNTDQVYQDTIETIIKEDSAGIYITRELSPKTVEENEMFEPLTSGDFNKRVLTNTVHHELLNIQMLPETEFQNEHLGNIVERMEQDRRIFGYLYLTRIIFNRDYTVGYLGYAFFCGTGCYWDNNIEIRKEGGKWIISKHFSGGIA